MVIENNSDIGTPLRKKHPLASFLKSIFCVFFLVSVCSAQTVQNQKGPQVLASALTAEQWLNKMHLAAIEENYRGTFVFMRGKMTSTMTVVHRYLNGVERERLQQLDGEMGEIIREGETVKCIFPDNRVVQVEQSTYVNKFTKSFVGFMPGDSQYDLTILGQERMIDRRCIVLGITAKDANRYSYRLWLDEQSGLLLKSAVQDAKGIDLERFQYTQIEFPDEVSDEALESMMTGEVVTHELIPTEKMDKKWASGMMWRSNWIPIGFEKVDGDNLVGDNVLVYSDGLATYSIFIEKINQNSMPEGASQVGATIAYVKKRRFGVHEYSVTVIGEIPAMTAMRVAESIEPVTSN